MRRTIYLVFPGLLTACSGSFPAPADGQAAALLWQLAARNTSRAADADVSGPLRIFATANTYSPGTTLTSVFQADNLCMTDPAYPGSGTFEALLAASGKRLPAQTSTWVLRAGMQYVDLSGNPVQEADASSLLPFPWRNPVSSGGAVWTGFTASWSIGNTCSGFSGTAGSGDTGQPAATSSQALYSSSAPCTGSARILCVEQPKPPAASLLKIFLTSASVRPGIDFTNIAQADALCLSDSRYPGSGSYKAMLAASGQRTSSSSFFEGDFQTDWVFQSERRYVRASDGAFLQNSNRRRLLPLPLSAGVAVGTAWTGISQQWTTSNNCSDWISSSGGVFGSVGSSSSQDRFFLSTGGNPCSNTTTQLLCVEQP